MTTRTRNQSRKFLTDAEWDAFSASYKKQMPLVGKTQDQCANGIRVLEIIPFMSSLPVLLAMKENVLTWAGLEPNKDFKSTFEKIIACLDKQIQRCKDFDAGIRDFVA